MNFCSIAVVADSGDAFAGVPVVELAIIFLCPYFADRLCVRVDYSTRKHFKGISPPIF